MCATKNFVSVRLYSAPQLHRTIVAMLQICAYGRSIQTGILPTFRPICEDLGRAALFADADPPPDLSTPANGSVATLARSTTKAFIHRSLCRLSYRSIERYRNGQVVALWVACLDVQSDHYPGRFV